MRKIIVDNLKMKPISDDRIHPNSFGYHLLSEQFLVSVEAKDIYELNKIVEISSANAKRFEYEDILRDIMFVEYDYMGFQFEKSHTIAYRKRLLKKKIENETRDFFKVYFNYSKYADTKDEILALLIKYTISLYE